MKRMYSEYDLEYAKNSLIETLDRLAIDDALRVQLMSYINRSFESEEVLEDNLRMLQQRHEERKYQKVLRKGVQGYGNENSRTR